LHFGVKIQDGGMISAILDFIGPVMDFLKSLCATFNRGFVYSTDVDGDADADGDVDLDADFVY